MCGIAGHAGRSHVPNARIEGCAAALRRRGPDGWRSHRWLDPGSEEVLLIHTRLRIIDLTERSDQPLQAGAHRLIFNGELYNYVELRDELKAKGESFETDGDGEVLLRVLMCHGAEGLDRCEGMWALAYLNQDSGTLLLSRDRFGEKPLYFTQVNEDLFFASEPKALAILRGEKPRINYYHLYRYLVNGYKSLYKTTDTFFEGVEELRPGEVLTWRAGAPVERKRYWTPRLQEDCCLTYDDAVVGVRDRLIRSVELRLRADVPLAFCMSGGIDSVSLISIAKRLFDHDVHGFTIVNEDARYEERDLVDHAVDELGIRHTAVQITSEGFLDNVRQIIRYHDAPIYTISYYVHWLLMSEIGRHGYTISISGTAADELLTGYYDHHNLYLYEARDSATFPRALAGWQHHVAPYVRNPYLREPLLYIRDHTVRDHVFLRNAEFAEYLRTTFREEFTEECYSKSLLRNRMLNELFHEAVPVILHEDDLNAMYYSIENRSPYLDRSLMEFCYAIPRELLIRDGFAKVVLRDAMAGVVPDRILWNPRKVGFNAPIASFVNLADSETRDWLLDDSPIWDHVHQAKIKNLIDRDSHLNSESKFLFYLICAKTFLEEFGQP